MLMFIMFRLFMFLSFPDVFLLLKFYIAHIFINIYLYIYIYFNLPIMHVDNNVGYIFNMHTLSITKNVRSYVFSGLFKFGLLEKT